MDNILAVGFTSGKISLISKDQNNGFVFYFILEWKIFYTTLAHHGGANSVQWISIHEKQFLCSGGTDGLIKLWLLSASVKKSQGFSLTLLNTLEGHSDAVRSISWMPFIEEKETFFIGGGVTFAKLASCAQVFNYNNLRIKKGLSGLLT